MGVGVCGPGVLQPRPVALGAPRRRMKVRGGRVCVCAYVRVYVGTLCVLCVFCGCHVCVCVCLFEGVYVCALALRACVGSVVLACIWGRWARMSGGFIFLTYF